MIKISPDQFDYHSPQGCQVEGKSKLQASLSMHKIYACSGEYMQVNGCMHRSKDTRKCKKQNPTTPDYYRESQTMDSSRLCAVFLFLSNSTKNKQIQQRGGDWEDCPVWNKTAGTGVAVKVEEGVSGMAGYVVMRQVVSVPIQCQATRRACSPPPQQPEAELIWLVRRFLR